MKHLSNKHDQRPEKGFSRKRVFLGLSSPVGLGYTADNPFDCFILVGDNNNYKGVNMKDSREVVGHISLTFSAFSKKVTRGNTFTGTLRTTLLKLDAGGEFPA